MDINRKIQENEKKRNRVLTHRVKETESVTRQIQSIRDAVETGDRKLDWLKEQLESVAKSGVYQIFVPSQGGSTEKNLQELYALEEMMTEIINTAYRIGFKKGIE